jgi:hypothetical protein
MFSFIMFLIYEVRRLFLNELESEIEKETAI